MSQYGLIPDLRPIAGRTSAITTNTSTGASHANAVADGVKHITVRTTSNCFIIIEKGTQVAVAGLITSANKTTHYPLFANEPPHFFPVQAGDRVGVIADTAAGVAYVTEMTK